MGIDFTLFLDSNNVIMDGIVSIRKYFDIQGSVKAVIRRVDNVIVVEPRTNFWSLKGSLASSVKLSDKQLKEARNDFLKKWPKS